jgi:hypothetical protein
MLTSRLGTGKSVTFFTAYLDNFSGGGWSMNDEATTHFASIIDNMEFGMNWLREHLGTIVMITGCFLFSISNE